MAPRPHAAAVLPGPGRAALTLFITLLALLCALLLPRPAVAQDVLPVPALSARVIDQTGTLGAGQRQSLETRLAELERETGTQLVILMVPSTAPEDIAAYAQRVGDEWKIGRRTVGDGLLLVVAKNDRRVRIEVAKALEGAIPDLAAKRVIDRAITPAFRAGDFAGGLQAAVDELAGLVRAEKLPAPASSPDGWSGAHSGSPRDAERGLQLQDLGLFFFIGVPVIGALLTGMLGRKLGALATGGATGGLAWLFGGSMVLALAAAVVALVLVGVLGIGSSGRRGRGGRGGWGGPPIIFPGGGWGGGGGGSWGGGGGGGFSSGGGGDFGGGGASGNW
ncbi:TPM domain-containing protein [Azohydromonas australica]|uniref:TPM domain-containing protein n=1 Tax=Azohydromonas australica TaxID=364039 RepID=UPI0004032AF7|nr:TPM domain-containing protein [Azohydromonas australica]